MRVPQASVRVGWHASDIAAEQLPTGAATLLFSDIEGSTRLVRELRDRYDEVLAEHQRLLRTAFVAHGGHEIDTQGDSFFVAFSSARDAVSAAVESQLSLLSHGWPDGIPVKVRMGIHSGRTVVRDDRYTGLAIHRAARICAAAHGGQILLSQATQALLEDEEEGSDFSLQDLGEYRLKDFDRPVRLYQATAGGLPSSFPALRSPVSSADAAEGAVKARLWRRPFAIAAAVLVLAAAAAIVFFSTRTASSTENLVPPNHIGIIDPETNSVLSDIAVGSNPGPVTAGNGSVWVGNLQDRTITRISLQDRTSNATISLGARTPTGLDFGAGALWVAHGLRGQLSRVDPRSNRVTRTIEVADPGSRRGAVTVGAGSVWVVYGDSTLARVNPQTMRVEGATFAGASPTGVVVANGSVWVANSGDGTVTRFVPQTLESGASSRPIRVGRRPMGIAAGEGAIWVANAGDNTVTRIDPFTKSTTTIRVGSGPTAVTVGGGVVWVANTAAGTVSRIDPVSNEVVSTIEVGNAPSGIVFSGDAVWVTVRAATQTHV